ncbi:hypothetical protein [Nocardia wallacei]|uniref:hypothetical protein n=1 Tax=Nocardia wallacei TaxID=480035 RepID=UPI00245569DF|nr:hypothetical protein [Nocardia wallacei]
MNSISRRFAALRGSGPGGVLLVAMAAAGLTLVLDVAALIRVRLGGPAAAFPGDTYGGDAELLWPWTVTALTALAVFAAVLGVLAWWLTRTRGPALVALGLTALPLLGVALVLQVVSPLMYDTTCSICDAVTYRRASGPTGYPPARATLLALTAVGIVAAVAAACSPATTRRIRATATPTDRPPHTATPTDQPPHTATVAGYALTAFAACAASLSVTTALIAATARKHTYSRGFVPLPADERAVGFAAAGLTLAVAAGTLWYARRLRQGRGGAAMLTLSGLGTAGWPVLAIALLISTPKGGVVPSGWWVEANPPWVREVHGLFAWAAVAALIPAVLTVLWPPTLRWMTRPERHSRTP